MFKTHRAGRKRVRTCKPRIWSEMKPSGPSHGLCLLGLALSVRVRPVVHVHKWVISACMHQSGCRESLPTLIFDPIYSIKAKQISKSKRGSAGINTREPKF
jgi:hypothetical protein